jgi:two-component system phosphate regulon response regulator PhoB
MATAKILIIEDDAAIAEIVAYNLHQVGYDVHLANDGRAGLEQALRTTPDLIILDLMLPSLDGIEVCRRLRTDPRTRDTLVLILTARAEENDQVVGFAVNADDYVTKPFSVKVLLERVRALLRRRESPTATQDMTTEQGVTLDRIRHAALAGDRDLDLTPTEFALLDTMIRQPGRAFRRSDLIDSAMGDDTIVLERTIDVHIRSLRKKLGEYADLIQTVRGIGYRFREHDATD